MRDCARAFVFFVENLHPDHTCYNVANENFTIAKIAEQFGDLWPGLSVEYPGIDDPDKRNYRVTSERLRSEGFEPRIGIEEGIESTMEALVSGIVTDPESIFYRNAKWLSELTQLGHKTPTEILDLMETMARHTPQGQ